jgi:hypothetical protein
VQLFAESGQSRLVLLREEVLDHADTPVIEERDVHVLARDEVDRRP